VTFTERCERLAGVISARQIAAGSCLWLTDSFVALGGGPRLAAWRLAGGPAGPWTACYVGDPAVERVVNRVLQRLPPPVAWHVAHGVLAIGQRGTGGFCTVVPKLPPCDEARQIVALTLPEGSESDHESIIAHEFAHAWTFDRVDPDRVVTSAERVAFCSELRPMLQQFPELIHEIITKDLRLEQLAVTLATEWGFSGPGTNISLAMRGTARAWSAR
jgi:hypothetical protein